MNRKTLSIVLGVVLIASFFLPYLNVAGIFKVSGLDIITGKGIMGEASKGSAEKYIMLLTPIAGVLLLVGALNNENYPLGRPIIGVLALIGVLYLIIRGLMEGGGKGMGEVFRFLGMGFWLGLIAAIVVLAYNPKPKS